jgi:hypothetical protein
MDIYKLIFDRLNNHAEYTELKTKLDEIRNLLYEINKLLDLLKLNHDNSVVYNKYKDDEKIVRLDALRNNLVKKLYDIEKQVQHDFAEEKLNELMNRVEEYLNVE